MRSSNFHEIRSHERASGGEVRAAATDVWQSHGLHQSYPECMAAELLKLAPGEIHPCRGVGVDLRMKPPGAERAKVPLNNRHLQFNVAAARNRAWHGNLFGESEYYRMTCTLNYPRRPRPLLCALQLAAALTGPACAAADKEPPASPEVTAVMQPYLDSYKLAGLVGIIADKPGRIHH